MKILLSNKNKIALELRHKKCRDKRECDRIKAILLAAEGWSTLMIAQALRKHETTIIRHLTEYVENKKLCPENGGSESHLNAIQTEALIQHLSDIHRLDIKR